MIFQKDKYVYRILFLAALLYIPLSLFRDFTPTNELKYINIVDHMIRSGDWIKLVFDGTLYSDKPPLYFWIVAIIRLITGKYTLFSINVVCCMIPAMIIGIDLYQFLRKNKFNPKHAFIAVVILYTTLYFVGSTLVIRMDILMTMFIQKALIAFYELVEQEQASKIRPYIYMGLGFLIKGLAAFLIPIGVIFAYLFISGQRWKIKKLGLRQGSAIVCFFVLLWLVPLVYHLGLVSTLRELLLKQTMDRVLDARVHKRAFYYYLVNFIPNLFPYSIFFFLSLIYTVFRIRQQDKFRMFVFCWFSFPFLAFSLISSKLDIYLIPSYAAIAILVEQFLLDGVEKKGKKSSMIVTSITFFLIPIAVFVKKKLILEIDPSLFCLFLIYGSFSILTGILGIRWATRKKYERFIYTIAGNITVLLVILTFSSPILNEYIGYQKFSEIIKSEKEKNQQLKILGFQESNVNRLRCLVGDYSIQNIRDSDLIETMTYQEDLLILLKNTKLPQLKKDYQLVYKNQKFSIIKYTHSENFTTE